MDYTIAAIPTMYNGRRYRSRLEARWAAFFDLVGWNAEYEPVDLGPWSPDFAIWGRATKYRMLVEVKPLVGWDRAVARKMADAIGTYSAFPLLLLGEAPLFDGDGFQQVGWLGQSTAYEVGWTEALLCRDSLGRLDIVANDEVVSGPVGAGTWLWEMPEHGSPVEVEPLWRKAANLVQWRGRDATP